MKRVLKALCVSVLPLASVVATVAIAPSTGGATTAPASQWPQLQQQAIGALQAHLGDGALVPQGALGSEIRSTFTDTAGKAVSLDKRALVVRSTKSGDTYQLALSLLGHRQLVVSALDDQRPGFAATAVLRPDSALVAHFSLEGARTAVSPHAAGGCGGYAADPQVEGTIFGILIEGTGYVQCDFGAESTTELVGIYSGSEVGNLASGSQYGAYLVVDDWAPCYLTPQQSLFQTRMIWSDNGVLGGGYTSGNASYGCVA